MLKVGDRFENPQTGASFDVLRAPGNGEDVLELRRIVTPRTGKTLPHVHLDYVERFVVESGSARAKVDGRAVSLGTGDELKVPAGTDHTNPANAGDQDLVMRHVFEPVSRFILAYIETLGQLMHQNRTNRQGDLPVAVIFALANETESQSFAAGLPKGLQRRVLAPLVARYARARGYDLRLP
jgi:mannose-6-phosphate isomerase-like protein (cupin superfamily)